MKAILQEIVQRLKDDVDLIILFGSHAWGKPTKESDLDLYIVTKEEYIPKNFEEKMQIIKRINKKIANFYKTTPIDLIVHTRGMHKKFLELQSSFSKELMNKGKVLWQTPLQKSGSKQPQTISKL